MRYFAHSRLLSLLHDSIVTIVIFTAGDERHAALIEWLMPIKREE